MLTFRKTFNLSTTKKAKFLDESLELIQLVILVVQDLQNAPLLQRLTANPI